MALQLPAKFLQDIQGTNTNLIPIVIIDPDGLNIKISTTSLTFDGDYYKPHVDGCTISAVTWFHKKPKAYTGGDIILEHKYKLPCLNNSMVIFPAIMWHEVTKVVMPNNEYGMGRYSMSQFLTL